MGVIFDERKLFDFETFLLLVPVFGSSGFPESRRHIPDRRTMDRSYRSSMIQQYVRSCIDTCTEIGTFQAVRKAHRKPETRMSRLRLLVSMKSAF